MYTIDKFCQLSKDEKMKLLSSIKSEPDVFSLILLSSIDRDNKECEMNGHDYTDWQNIEYTDCELWYSDPELHGTEDGLLWRDVVKQVRMCQRCAHLEMHELSSKISDKNKFKTYFGK